MDMCPDLEEFIPEETAVGRLNKQDLLNFKKMEAKTMSKN
jgi:hypothetical protein